MAIDISRVTTASSVALQAAELDAVSSTSMDDTLLTIPVQTFAGQQKVSRQAIDRGRGIDTMVLNDLLARCAATLDSTLLTQASTGLSAMATATTYDDTQPTAAKLYPKILQTQAAVEAILLGPPVSHVTMHSRRWAWLSSQMTSTWPLINTAGIPTQAGGTADPNASYATGIRGTLPNGLAVCVDNNLPTNGGVGVNQDSIFVTPRDECHLWEMAGGATYIRAEQVAAAQLGVLIVCWEYAAYTFGRYPAGAMGAISGTALVSPSF